MSDELIPPQYQPYQQRVVDEQKELGERIEKLQAHINSDFFTTESGDERSRKLMQLRIMRDLYEVLGERIRAFT